MTCLGFTFTTLALKKIYYYLVFVFVVAGTHDQIDLYKAPGNILTKLNGYDTIESVF